ncbi:MAG TPA: hypothetical protein VLF21_02995 [Candidatus Saccharimonadales bacterium]|nr:hypothetical protein [Candidatus Saccharimonadales bacterium]
MATQRKVKRITSGRQAAIKHYQARDSWDLPDWAQEWLVQNGGWVVLVFALILAPVAALAVTLGIHALPLEFIGVPATDTDIGGAAISLIIEFVLIAMAVRPVFERQLKGWRYLILGAVVHLVHSLFLGHAISGTLILLATIYLYRQVRHAYE